MDRGSEAAQRAKSSKVLFGLLRRAAEQKAALCQQSVTTTATAVTTTATATAAATTTETATATAAATTTAKPPQAPTTVRHDRLQERLAHIARWRHARARSLRTAETEAKIDDAKIEATTGSPIEKPRLSRRRLRDEAANDSRRSRRSSGDGEETASAESESSRSLSLSLSVSVSLSPSRRDRPRRARRPPSPLKVGLDRLELETAVVRPGDGDEDPSGPRKKPRHRDRDRDRDRDCKASDCAHGMKAVVARRSPIEVLSRFMSRILRGSASVKTAATTAPTAPTATTATTVSKPKPLVEWRHPNGTRIFKRALTDAEEAARRVRHEARARREAERRARFEAMGIDATAAACIGHVFDDGNDDEAQPVGSDDDDDDNDNDNDDDNSTKAKMRSDGSSSAAAGATTDHTPLAMAKDLIFKALQNEYRARLFARLPAVATCATTTAAATAAAAARMPTTGSTSSTSTSTATSTSTFTATATACRDDTNG